MANKIGFYGYPPKEIINNYKNSQYGFLDLDIDYGVPDCGILPPVTCQIIKNIVNNACFYRNDLELIIATTQEDKCDNGRFVAKILIEMGFKVLTTTNKNQKKRDIRICNSQLALKEKIDLIMRSIYEDILLPPLKVVKPQTGFWGVPPNDFSILELFPAHTEVFGWTRCVEAGVPSDLELEIYVKPEVKTVFFTQSFCSKGILAKYLAEKNNGLYIDLDKKATHSIKAKIEAFIRLK